MKEQEITTKSAKETQEAAGKFAAEILAAGERKGVRVVCLWGNLGSGKTTFVQGVAAAAGVSGIVNSPTFLIMKKYPLRGKNTTHPALRAPASAKALARRAPLKRGIDASMRYFYHFDCYRVRSAEEVADLGWTEILSGADDLVFVEWPEKIMEILPEKRMDIIFENLGADARRITLKERG